MMKILNLLVGVLLCLCISPVAVKAQQLPAQNVFSSTGFIWNPAMTAFEHKWEVGVVHEQSWSGFEDNPQTTMAYGQYPFAKQASSLGAFLVLDQIAPIKNNIVGLSYAYKLGLGNTSRRRRKSMRKEAQLSIGLSVAMHQIFVQSADYIIKDPADPLKPIGELNSVSPNIGVGVFFASRPSGPEDRSFFYLGAGTNQLLSNDIFIDNGGDIRGNLKRALHGNGRIGYRSVQEQFSLEPSLWFNMTDASILNSQFNLEGEYGQSIWGGLHYNTNQTIMLQLGYRLASEVVEAGELRIGLSTSFNTGGFGPERGVGYGFTLSFKGM